MNKIVLCCIYTLFITLMSSPLYAQEVSQAPSIPNEAQTKEQSLRDLNIFIIRDFDGPSLLLVSLSNIYDYSLDRMSISGNAHKGFVKLQYKINGAYRKNFLTNTGLSETDTLYIHHYPSGRTISLPVKDLNVVARLGIYESLSDAPFSEDDYMLGFEIPPEALAPLRGSFYSCFVYIGQENPFSQEPLQSLAWSKIDAQRFPKTTKIQDDKTFAGRSDYTSHTIGNIYLSETNGLQYYLQERVNHETQLNGRRLLILEPKTQQIVFDLFFAENEGASFTRLNGIQGSNDASQWAGQLFKNQEQVTFGFMDVSFGCAGIWVAGPDEYISVNCDNRH